MLKVTGRLFFLQKQIIYPLFIYIYINLVLEAHAYEFYYNKFLVWTVILSLITMLESFYDLDINFFMFQIFFDPIFQATPSNLHPPPFRFFKIFFANYVIISSNLIFFCCTLIIVLHHNLKVTLFYFICPTNQVNEVNGRKEKQNTSF